MARTQSKNVGLRISEATKAYLAKAARMKGLKLGTWLKMIAREEAAKLLPEAPPMLDEDEAPEPSPRKPKSRAKRKP